MATPTDREPVLRKEPLAHTIDRQQYVPAYLALVSNSLQWSGSQLYLRNFGIGINDWRVLTSLGNRPGSTAVALSNWLDMNKSMVSRSFRTLQDMRLIGTDSKVGRKKFYLTATGAALHEQMMPIAMRRNDILLQGFSDEEQSALLDFLRRMHTNMNMVRTHDNSGVSETPSAAATTDED